MADKAILPGDEINSLGIDEDGSRWSSLAVEEVVITGEVSNGAGAAVSIAAISQALALISTSGSGALFLADDGLYHEVSSGDTSGSATVGTGVMYKADYDNDEDGVVNMAALALVCEAIEGVTQAGANMYYGTDTSGSAGFFSLPEVSVSTEGSSGIPEHDHNDLYYSEDEIDSFLLLKSDTDHNHDTNYDTLGSAALVEDTLNAHLGVDNPHGLTALSLSALEMVEVTALPSTSAAVANVIYARNALGDWSDSSDGFYKLMGSTFVEVGGA